MYLIGDTHGNFRALAEWNSKHMDQTLIHVGDFGMGFYHNDRPLAAHAWKFAGALKSEDQGTIFQGLDVDQIVEWKIDVSRRAAKLV